MNRFSDLDEDEVRALVRGAVGRRLGQEGASSADPQAAFRAHASHRLLPLPSGADEGGPCLIEPAVRCNHCGYCLSYGH